MSTARLSTAQVAVLAALLVEARELSNAELTTVAGVSLTGEDRRGLVADGLIEQRKVGQSYAFQLSPAGWSTVVSVLAAQERGKGAVAGTVGTLLTGLSRALAARGTDALSFFGGSRPQEAVAVTDVDSSERDTEERIRTGYVKLATEPAGWVSLADLRELLADIPRADIDTALKWLAVQPGVRLIPVANLKSLSTRERDAALRFGGEENHAMAIEG
jgi:hypothetical protein